MKFEETRFPVHIQDIKDSADALVILHKLWQDNWNAKDIGSKIWVNPQTIRNILNRKKKEDWWIITTNICNKLIEAYNKWIFNK